MRKHRLLALALCVCTGLATPTDGLARGTIVDQNRQPLAQTEARTGRRLYPYEETARQLLGEVYGFDGINGVEESMDAWLSERYAQHTVQLTLDIDLQRAAEASLAALIAESKSPRANGAIVVMDMRGRVLAMASESKTPVALSEENHAIMASSAPGELFLMVPALRALSDTRETDWIAPYLALDETISDGGEFALFTRQNHPHCWIDPANIAAHADLNIADAIHNNCYYFFYILSLRFGMNGEPVHAFAKRLGLSGLTGIELAGETESLVAVQDTLYLPGKTQQSTDTPLVLYNDLRETISAHASASGLDIGDAETAACARAMMALALEPRGSEQSKHWRRHITSQLTALGFPIEQAMRSEMLDTYVEKIMPLAYDGLDMINMTIGQSFTQVTPIAMARYMTALANGGRVYPASLIESIETPEGDVIQRYVERMPVDDLSVAIGEYLPAIHSALRGVVDRTGMSADAAAQWDQRLNVASMKAFGRDEASGELGSLWYAGFAPYDAPEIVVVVNMLDGDTATDDVFPAGRAVFDAWFAQIN